MVFSRQNTELTQKFTQRKKIKYIKDNSRARVGRPGSMQSAEASGGSGGSAGAGGAAAGAARPTGPEFVLGAVCTGSVRLDGKQLEMVQTHMPPEGGAGGGTASGAAAGAAVETSHGRRSIKNEEDTNKELASLWSAIVNGDDNALHTLGVQLRPRCEWENPSFFQYKMAVSKVYQHFLQSRGQNRQWISWEAMKIACRCVTMTGDQTWCRLRCGNPPRMNLLVSARFQGLPDMFGEEAVAEGVIAAINPERMEIKLENVVWVHRDRKKWNNLDPETKKDWQVAVVSSNPSVPAGWHVTTISHRSAE